MMKSIFSRDVIRSPFLPIALAFLLLGLIVTQDGGQNAASRLLSMRAVVESGSFAIDPYLKSTDDWSLAPNGHYYSNKAPGSILLGLPVFYVLDEVHRPFEKIPEDGIRPQPEYFQNTFLSLFVQGLPYAILCLFICAYLYRSWVPLDGVYLFFLSALFGNTAVVFMNSYFGHALSAVLQLGALFFLLKRNYSLFGLFCSLAMLSDYGFFFQIPAVLVAFFLSRPGLKGALNATLFAIPAAIAWSLYHGLIFGSPFVVASKFQNPVFLDQTNEVFWGMFSLPHWPWVWELIFGQSRGLIVQQPWIFLVVPFSLIAILRDKRKSPHLIPWVYCVFGLVGLLFMNASFNGWHGGATAGPRYLAGILPCFALLGAISYSGWNKPMRVAVWSLVGVSILFRGLMYGGTILAPMESLWSYYIRELLSRGTPALRSAIFIVLLAVSLVLSYRRSKRVWI